MPVLFQDLSATGLLLLPSADKLITGQWGNFIHLTILGITVT